MFLAPLSQYVVQLPLSEIAVAYFPLQNTSSLVKLNEELAHLFPGLIADSQLILAIVDFDRNVLTYKYPLI